MAKKYASLTNLQNLVDNIKALFVKKTDLETTLSGYDTKGSAAAVQTNLDEVSDTLDAHTDNADIHVTTTNKSNWNSAYTHSASAHARTDATNVSDSTTNGNIKINGTETNVYSHPNSSVTAGTYKSVTVNAQGHVTGGSNPTTLAGYGITDAESKSDASAKLTEAKTYTDTVASTKSDSTHNHDSAYDAKGAAAEALNSAKNYADSAASSAANTVKNDLLNGAGGAYDTLKELGDLINENTDAIDALETVASGKADKTHTHAISEVNDLQTTLDTMNENLRNNTWYGTCSTAAATTEKVVTTASGDFRLETGSIVYVLFTYASCANATLNVDGKGAKAIKIVGNNNVSTYHWGLNEVVGFAYDGTYFRMLDGQVATTTYYGVTKLSSSTSSTSTTAAATPSAVKAAYDLANSKQDPATTLSGYGITDAYTKADHEWVQIYDSGATTEQINSFANINISGYKKIMMAIKCVNDTTNASTTRYGSAIFKATNGTTYQFPVFNSMFFGSETTTASMAFFEFTDGWIICPQVVRSIKYADFLTSTEGGTCTNMNNMGSGLMKCTNPLSTVTISNLDQNADFFFGVGSRVIIWGSVI